MTLFSVGMEWASEDVSPDIYDEDRFDVVNEVLSDYSPALGFGADRYSIQIAVEGASPVQALDGAQSVADQAIQKAELPQWPLVWSEVTEWNEFERRLDEPTYPRLLGVAELSELLKISKQRASVIARSQAFPRPAAELASGPVWFESNVLRFADEWEQRRKPGRPRKLTADDLKAAEGASIEARNWDKENPLASDGISFPG